MINALKGIIHRDILLGLLVMVVWAGNAVVIKFITLEVTPFIGLALRLIVGTLVFLPFLRWVGRESFYRILLIMAFMSILHWGSLIWSIDKLDASMASILLQVQIIFTALIGRFVFAEAFGWRTGAGIMMGIIGVIVLVGLPQNPPLAIGVIGMVFSMLTVAISYAFMKGLSGVSPTNYIAHMHIIPLVPIVILAFVFEQPSEVDWGGIDYKILTFMIAYQVLLVSSVHMLWQRLMTRNAMSVLPNLTLLLPVLGVVMAMVFLGERITPSMVAGGAMTMIGVGIVMWRRQVKAVVE